MSISLPLPHTTLLHSIVSIFPLEHPIFFYTIHVDTQITKGSFINDEIPAYLVTWQTQETECWRKGTQWDEVVVGNPDVVLNVRYAIAITRVAENVDDEVTSGWKIVEVSVSARIALWAE